MSNPVLLVAVLFSSLFTGGLGMAAASGQETERIKEEGFSTARNPVIGPGRFSKGRDSARKERGEKKEPLAKRRFADEDFLEVKKSGGKNTTPLEVRSWETGFEFEPPIGPGMGGTGGTRPTENDKIFFPSSYGSLGITGQGAELTLLGENQNNFLSGKEEASGEPRRDWHGIARDTALYMGYQGVVAGVLWLLPESVTSWTRDQKKATLKKWNENVESPVWDRDKWWINYVGHPYWGATFYIRARERGFGPFGSFCYSALLSSLYEFGIEAFFEPPSYQDLIVTPLGGYFVGRYIFEPIREKIKSKPEREWYDHIALILSDPLGAANSLFERLLGIKTDIRVKLRSPGLSPPNPFDPWRAAPRGGEWEKSIPHPGFSLELRMVWE